MTTTKPKPPTPEEPEEIDALVGQLHACGATEGELVGLLHELRCGRCGKALERPHEPHAAAQFDVLCRWWTTSHDPDPIATD